MPHVFKLFLWSICLAFVALALKLLFDEERAVSPETMVSRIRNSGF
ncbi:MAG: hypothetical protein JW913_13970 [Chitinispirillaceae bacterium]|nr:hypothetical protein [Chitinispirillaceae bacterium]